jgi:hypothetical protein
VKQFTGQVASDGKQIRFDAPVLWLSALGRAKGKRVIVTVERETERRSNPQNRRFFGVIVPVCTEILNQQMRNNGSVVVLTKDRVHGLLDGWFLGFEETPLGPARRHCSDLDTAKFAAFMDEIERHFRTEYGAVFPDEDAVREAML